MSEKIRIGTHNNPLALWRANAVRQMLEKLGHDIQIIEITGNFEQAMLNNNIDIAVHDLKNLPNVLPNGIVQAAVIKRGNFKDVLVFKDNEEFLSQREAVIATENLRQRAQWLNRYPTHTIVELNGDIDHQLQQLEDNDNWNAAIFSAAALGRLNVKPENSINLDWMIPTPAQGAISITVLEKNEVIKTICAELNHVETEICTQIEREFSSLLDEDSTLPIGALAFVKEVGDEKEITFKGILLSPDGSKKIEVNRVEKLIKYDEVAPFSADYIIERGGKTLLGTIKRSSQQTNIYSTKTLTTSQRLLFNESVVAESSDFIKISLNRIKPQIIRNPINNVIITNKHSVEALLHNFSAVELQFKNIYCVGRTTKRLIEKRIGNIKHVEKNLKNLAEHLVEYIEGTEVTCFCGDNEIETFTNILEENNITVNVVEVYQTKYDAEKVNDTVEGILFFTPLAIKSYLKENDRDKIAFCNGEKTAQEAKKRFEDVRIAKLPTVESVIELVNEHYA